MCRSCTDLSGQFTYRVGSYSSFLRWRSRAEVLRHFFDGTSLGEATVVHPDGREENVTRLEWQRMEVVGER